MSKKRSKNDNNSLARYWQSHIDKWGNSGLSQSEYCRQNNISRDRFTYWKIKFKRKNLPLEIVQVSHVSHVMPKTDLKLNIGADIQIVIPEDFSQVTLEMVLKTLKVL